MTNMKSVLTGLALLLPMTTPGAAEVTLSADYLQGRWSTGGEQGCQSEQVSYVDFHSNHTLEAGKGDAVTTVGFWQLDDDRVVLHLLVSPSPGREGHPFFQQRYYYQYMSPTILALKADSIDYTHDTGAEAGKTKTVTRCK